MSSQSNSSSSLTLQSYFFAQQEIEREQDYSTSCEYEGTLQEIENGYAESQTSLEKIQSTSTVNENEAEMLPSCETFTCGSGDSDSECGEISSDSDSDSVTSGFFLESGDSDTDCQDSIDSPDDEAPNDIPPRKSFSAQEEACMSILSLIARHCITTEAAKDIIDLLKLLCPANELLQSLTYSKVQEVCGNCTVFTYDICENCLGLFPTNVEDQVVCSTTGCNGYVHISTLWACII